MVPPSRFINYNLISLRLRQGERQKTHTEPQLALFDQFLIPN